MARNGLAKRPSGHESPRLEHERHEDDTTTPPPNAVLEFAWFTLSAAQGWLALGDWQSANEELERIAPQFREHPDVLDVRWRVYAMGAQWEKAEQGGIAQ